MVSCQGLACLSLGRFLTTMIRLRISVLCKKNLKSSLTPIHTNRIVSLDIVNLFLEVPTDKNLFVVRDKLESDLFLVERTSPIDHLKAMLTFSVKTTYFQLGFNISYGIAIVSCNRKHRYEIIQRNSYGSITIKPNYEIRYIDYTFIL